MKNYINYFAFTLLLIMTTNSLAKTNVSTDSITEVNIEKAILNPNDVIRLDLSNQKINFENIDLSQFKNLEFLSLENEHLKELPKGLSSLKKLKTLNLSGNDFKNLPSDFEELTSFEELFLNNETNFKFNDNIKTLSKLPNLKTLHLENDNLKKLIFLSSVSVYSNVNFSKKIDENTSNWRSRIYWIPFNTKAS